MNAVATDSRAFTQPRRLPMVPPRWPRRHAEHQAVASGWRLIEADAGEGEVPTRVERGRSAVEEVLIEQERRWLIERGLIERLFAWCAELKRRGAEEELPWSSASEEDFWAFFVSRPGLREPGVVLTDDGNLRAAWRNAAGEQVALEFRGFGDVSFVLFARRPQAQQMARTVGTGELSRIAGKIAADGLTELVYG
jgi:hypothetical protein